MKYPLSHSLVVLLMFPLVVSADSWNHRGFKDGMTYAEFVRHADRLGFGTSQCTERNSCSIVKRNPFDLLSFQFCNSSKDLKDIWFSPKGNTISVFVEAVEELKSTYDLVALSDSIYTKKMKGYMSDGNPVSTSKFGVHLFNRTSNSYFSVSIEGEDDNTYGQELRTQIVMRGVCD